MQAESLTRRRMLATGSRRCQESRFLVTSKAAELATGSQHIASLGLPHKHIESRASQNRLEAEDGGVSWSCEGSAGKFVERNEIDFAAHSVQQFRESLGVLLRVVHDGQEDGLHGEALAGQ